MDRNENPIVIPLLQDALGNLHNPLYRPDERLVAHLPALEGNLCQLLLKAIEDMEPAQTVPTDAPACRYHRLLTLRYIDGLTQEAAAESMGISSRYLRDLQRLSIQALTNHLRESTGDPSRGGESADQEQLTQELVSLERTTPSPSTDIDAALRGALTLVQMLDCACVIEIEVPESTSEATLAIHPSAMKQVLVSSLEQLARAMSHGRITISTTAARAPDLGGRLEILLRSEPAVSFSGRDLGLVNDLLRPYGGHASVSHTPTATTLAIDVPIAADSPIRVLVVDDNEDLVEFYRAYTIGTAYQIDQVRTGRSALAYAKANPPDLLVLDVMLPDIDGWDLLIQLRHQPLTSSIPVVVCSVIYDEELAYALGAVCCVKKPVRRREFLSALGSARSLAHHQ